MQTEYPDRRYAWYVVGVLTLANVSGFVDRQILSLLVQPIRRDLGLSLTEMSYLIGLPFAIFYTVMGLPIARLADSGNRRNVMAAGVALWSIATSLCGVAGTFGRLLLARIGVGVGEAALQPPAASLLADYFPRSVLGSAMSVYSLGVFLGSGLAYFIGGWIVGLVSAQASWTLPLVGTLHPWQTVFFMIGLPGLLIALLMLTIREPARQESTSGAIPISVFIAHVRANLRTFASIAFGYALSASVNYGIAAWLATFLIQRLGWTAERAGMVQGLLTMTVGVLGVLTGGWIMNAFVKAGRTDAALRVGIVGALGMLVSATAYPFASSSVIVVLCLVVVNFFAALPWGAAYAGSAEIAPARMRAQSAALFLFVLNLVSALLGPWAVAAITDFVFHRDTALPYSLAIVNLVGMLGAIGLLTWGLPAYRKTVSLRP